MTYWRKCPRCVGFDVGRPIVRFAGVDDSREWTEPALQSRQVSAKVCPEDVQREANRRRRLLRLDEHRVQEFVTGHPMPHAIVETARHIEYAAQALCRLTPIPADYDNDVYWPGMW